MWNQRCVSSLHHNAGAQHRVRNDTAGSVSWLHRIGGAYSTTGRSSGFVMEIIASGRRDAIVLCGDGRLVPTVCRSILLPIRSTVPPIIIALQLRPTPYADRTARDTWLSHTPVTTGCSVISRGAGGPHCSATVPPRHFESDLQLCESNLIHKAVFALRMVDALPVYELQR